MPVEQIEERPGLPELVLTQGNSRLRLSLQGAHITELALDGEDLLWMSRCANFVEGAAIRGGIPICWPWFGASPDNREWPQHGFARTHPFRLVSQTSTAQYTGVVLALEAPAVMDAWRDVASLEVEVRLSDHLWMELRTTNTSGRDILVGAGLHSYFSVADCGEVSIPGLTGLTYLDKPSGFSRQTQREPLHIDGEVDRVYLNPPRSVELIDGGPARRVQIDSWGNTDLVLWNPGAAVAAAMADFDDHGYERMLCIEPAIALDNRVRLSPAACHTLGQTIRACRSPRP